MDTTFTEDNSVAVEDVLLGSQLVGYTLGLMATVASMAIAWSFSGFWLVLIMYVISTIILALLAGLATAGVCYAIGMPGLATVSQAAKPVISRISSFFTTKE